MYCYKCGCELTKSNHCPNCGIDVTQYKKIIYTSNYMYNTGLERAQVRDLSGAIEALKQSLWFNKDNLQARNLLGLCYFEIGESVAAFSEWVISKSINDKRLHEKDNLADTYLRMFDEGSQMVANITAAIRRYNHALECCYTDNLDVAILQLKKVLQLNTHYLRARQLLALLYIENHQWSRAEKELRKCKLLDANNTTTLRYMKEVEAKLSPEQQGKNLPDRKNEGRTKKEINKAAGIVKYEEDNETIIQPIGTRTPGVDGFRFPSALTGGIIGLIIGAAAVAFLVMPARVETVRQQSTTQVQTVSEELDKQKAAAEKLQAQVDKLNKSAGGNTADITKEQQTKINALLNTAAAYLKDPKDSETIAAAFADTDPSTATEGMSTEYTALYNALYPNIKDILLDQYYLAGAKAYEADEPDYAAAIKNLTLAVKFDDQNNPSKSYPQMLAYLGQSYYKSYEAADEKTKSGEMKDYLSNAKAYLEKLVHDYPKSDYAADAEKTLAQIPETVTAAKIFASTDVEEDTSEKARESAASPEVSGTARSSTSAGQNTASQTTADAGQNNAADNAAAANGADQTAAAQNQNTASQDQTAAAAAQQAAAQQAAAAAAAAQQQAAAQQAAAAQAAAAAAQQQAAAAAQQQAAQGGQ